MHDQTDPDTLIDADELVATYLQAIPRGQELATRDHLFHQHLTWLRTIIPVLDRVLRDDGVDPRIRHRAATTIVYGTPDTDTAIAELRRYDAALDRLQESVIGDLAPDHQFTGLLGLTEDGQQ